MSKTKNNVFLIHIHISFYLLTKILIYRFLKLINMAKGSEQKMKKERNFIYVN